MTTLTTDLAKPRGKQAWQLEPHSIWYPRTTGIWQTVWLEVIPDSYMRRTANIERWEISLDTRIAGRSVRATSGDSTDFDGSGRLLLHAVH